MGYAKKLFLIFVLLIPCLGIGRLGGSDLNVYRMAGKFVALGEPLRAYAESAQIGNYFDGPPFLAFTGLLAQMKYEKAKWFWLGIETVAYVIFWFFFLRLFPELLSRRTRWAFLFVWIASIKPIHASFQSFNVQLIIAAALLWSEVWSRSSSRRLRFLSGIPISLVSLWKVYPAFIWIYFLFTKRSEVRAGLFGGVALAFLIPILSFGFSDGALSYGAFLKGLGSYHSAYDLGSHVVSLSLPSLIARWFNFLDVSALGWLIGGTVATLSLIFFAAVFKARRRGVSVGNQSEWFALAMALMAFLNNGSRPDYFVFYVPAFAVLGIWATSPASSQWYRYGFFAALGLIAFISEWTLGSRDLTHQLEAIRLPVLGMIILVSLLAGGIRAYQDSKLQESN